MAFEKCNRCAGKGAILRGGGRDGAVKCTSCDGTGQVSNAPPPPKKPKRKRLKSEWLPAVPAYPVLPARKA